MERTNSSGVLATPLRLEEEDKLGLETLDLKMSL
jgi:hypothetical protein